MSFRLGIIILFHFVQLCFSKETPVTNSFLEHSIIENLHYKPQWVLNNWEKYKNSVSNDNDKLGWAYFMQSIAYYNINNFQKAIDNAEIAINTNSLTNDKFLVSYSYLYIAQSFQKLGNDTLYIYYLNRSLDCYPENSQRNDYLAFMYESKYIYYAKHQKSDLTIYYLKKASEFCAKSVFPDELLKNHNIYFSIKGHLLQSEYESLQKNWKFAEIEAKVGMELSKKIYHSQLEVQCIMQLGKIFYLQKDYEKAIALYEKAEILKASIYDWDVTEELYKKLYEIYKITNNQKAKYYLQKYESIQNQHRLLINPQKKEIQKHLHKINETNYASFIKYAGICSLILLTIFLLIRYYYRGKNLSQVSSKEFSLNDFNFLSRFYWGRKLLFQSVEQENDLENKYKMVMLNFFFFSISVIFLLQAFYYIWIDYFPIPYLYGILFLYIFITIFTKLKKNKLSQIIFLLVVVVGIFYYNLYSSNVGIEFLYISVIISSLFLFDFRKEKLYLFFTVFFVLLAYCSRFINGFQPQEQQPSLYLLRFLWANLILTFLVILLYIYLLNKKREFTDYSVIFEKDIAIKQLENQVNDAFEEVIMLAKNNHPEFLSRFQEVYPEFISNLKIRYPNLTSEDHKFIALLKFNFTTKEIANYTFLTMLSVKKKKGRLRKKLNLSTGYDLYSWVGEL